MRQKANFVFWKFQLLGVTFLSSVYFFSLSSILFFLLTWFNQKNSPLVSFRIWTNWSDFKCSWECLGSRVTTFIIGDGLRTILASLFLFLFIRALFLFIKRIKETKKFKEVLESIASSQKTFEIKYFIFPFVYPLALIIGWFKPKIFLSTSLINSLQPEELKIVLLHELFHQKKRHPLKNLFLSFLADLLFFFPLTKKMKELLSLAQELRADFQAVDKEKNLAFLFACLNKIYKPLFFPFNLTYFSAGPVNNYARWQYLKEDRLKLSLSWRRGIISILIFGFFFFLTFSPLWQKAWKTILEHKPTCFSHSIIKEGQA